MQRKDLLENEMVAADSLLPVEVWYQIFSSFNKRQLHTIKAKPPCSLFWQIASDPSLIKKGALDYNKPLCLQKKEVAGIEYSKESLCIALDN